MSLSEMLTWSRFRDLFRTSAPTAPVEDEDGFVHAPDATPDDVPVVKGPHTGNGYGGFSGWGGGAGT